MSSIPYTFPEISSIYLTKVIKDCTCGFSITLLKPYCDTDQNTYRAHNRNKYHHVYSAHLSNRLIAAGFWIMSSRKREGMLCQRDTIRSWAQCANHLLFDCWVQFLKHFNKLRYSPRLHLNLKQPAPRSALGRCQAALIKVHLRLVFCGFWGGVSCVLCRSLACSFFLAFLLSADRPVLLCRHVLLGKLHLGLGLGHNGVTSGEQLLENSMRNTCTNDFIKRNTVLWEI